MRSVICLLLMCLVSGLVHGAEPPAQVVVSPYVVPAAPAATAPAAVSAAAVTTPSKPLTNPLVTPDAPPPTPYYKQPLFWTAIAVGAVLIGTVCWGIAWTTTQTPRYALVKF